MSWFLIGAMPGALIWAIILILPWRPWSTRERLEALPLKSPADLSDLTVLIPARNEAGSLRRTLPSLMAQGVGLRAVLVDDQSSDGTSETAAAGLSDLVVVRGEPLPPGWSGKVWALEQGRPYLRRPLTLLLDADIELSPGFLPQLKKQMKKSGAELVTVMPELCMRGFWAKLLIPSFVYFFKLLYPFHLVNRRGSKAAAAAGGCILLHTRLLDEIGGFGALKAALIDDCTLARLVKDRGYGVWIGLTRSARSLRPYTRLGDIWAMVSRSAYTQLGYSSYWLAACSILMLAAFAGPVVGLLGGGGVSAMLGALGLSVMILSYLPTLRFYGLFQAWSVAAPLAGMLYLAMTWTSALRYWRGERSSWKGRVYARSPT